MVFDPKSLLSYDPVGLVHSPKTLKPENTKNKTEKSTRSPTQGRAPKIRNKPWKKRSFSGLFFFFRGGGFYVFSFFVLGIFCVFGFWVKKIPTSQNPRNPEKCKVTRKRLKSDFWGLPQSNPPSNPKSNFLTQK